MKHELAQMLDSVGHVAAFTVEPIEAPARRCHKLAYGDVAKAAWSAKSRQSAVTNLPAIDPPISRIRALTNRTQTLSYVIF